MDFHPELLTIKEFGLSAFGIIYREILVGQSVASGIRLLQYPQTDLQRKIIRSEFDVLFGKSHFCSCNPKVPNRQIFYHELESLLYGVSVPTKVEWFKALFLAYSYALGRVFEKAPTIFFNMHPMKWPVEDCKKEMLDIYDKFDNLKVVSIVRNQLSELGSVMECEAKLHENEFDYLKYIEIVINRTALYCSQDDVWYDKRGVVRFEDLKLYPLETLKAISDFCEIGYSENMLRVTANGTDNGYRYAGTYTDGWSVAPVYNLHENYVLDYSQVSKHDLCQNKSNAR